MTFAAQNQLEAVLLKEGPCLSSRFCELLIEAGHKPEAARKRISRANGAVKYIDDLIFPKGTRFYYHQSHYNFPHYWEALITALQQKSPVYAAAIAALQARGGIVPESYFPIICGSPVKQKGQVASEEVLRRLIGAQVLERIEVSGVGPCVAFVINQYFSRIDEDLFRVRLLAEKIMLLAVKDWARKNGLASYEKVALRDIGQPLPNVGTFAWDLTAPCYLLPLVRRDAKGKPKPGFLVCDIVVDRIIVESAMEAFVRKCRTVTALQKLSPILPVILADGFTKEARRLGKSYGVMVASPAGLFGQEIAKAFKALISTMTNLAAVAAKNPAVIGDLFDKFGQIEGAAGNLRGALFEMMVGHCTAKVDDGLVDIRKKIRDLSTGNPAEIDVFRYKHKEAWSYECKGYLPTNHIDVDEVEKWISVTIPRIHASLSSERRFAVNGFSFHYEFWTCGGFTPEALAKLEAASTKTRKYKIGWKDGEQVRKYISGVHPSTIADMFDEHFFKHPIARISKKFDVAPKEFANANDDEDLEDIEDDEAVDLDSINWDDDLEEIEEPKKPKKRKAS